MWTAADARLLGAAGFRDRILRVLMEPADRNPAAAVATAAEAASELARLGVTARQVHHGYDLATWDVMRAAVAMGQDIRVGLEDTTVLPDGSVGGRERQNWWRRRSASSANREISDTCRPCGGSCWLHSSGGGIV